MWYNELLFVLMVTAFVGMGVMALIVKVNMNQRKNSIEKKEEIPEKILVAEKKASYEPIQKVSDPEPEPLETIISEDIFKPIIIQATNDMPVPSTVPEPAVAPALVVPADPINEPPSENIDQLIKMFPVNQAPETQIAPSEPSPVKAELLRNTENQFFDLRYDYNQQNIEDVPTIPDDEISIVYKEEQSEEHVSGIVTCQHCKSEVPQTLYCIYCGNPLTVKPLDYDK